MSLDKDRLVRWEFAPHARTCHPREEHPLPLMVCGGIAGYKKALAPQIKKIRLGMNIDYGVLNGDPRAENFLNQGMESLDEVTDILLFTDGLSIPKQVPEKRKDYTSLVKAYLALGLNGVKDMIRHKEDTDPLCMAYPRFKCNDDITAIAVKI